jgi:hypothetical protein
MNRLCLHSWTGILVGSPLPVAKAGAALPGVHTKHDIIININRLTAQGQNYINKIKMTKGTQSTYLSEIGERRYFMFFETRFAFHLSNMRWN